MTRTPQRPVSPPPAAPPATATATKPKGERLLALDAFRGLTILAMIVVNNPGAWGEQYQYWPLEHATWHGWTPTDLIFPFFLFIVGTALAFSLRRFLEGGRIAPGVYWRIVRRTLALILLGLFLSSLGQIIDLISGDIQSIDFASIRFPGVLQRIAVVYFFTSLIVLHMPLRAQIVLAVVLLVGYWALLAFLPNPRDYTSNLSPEGNITRVVDIAVFTEGHMYTHARTEKTEPEGLLSTLPAIVTCLLGYWSGLAIQRHGTNYLTIVLLLGCGALGVELGLLWNNVFPINKKIWTSSFVLLTGGLAMQLLAGCLLKFDIWGWRRLARPFAVVGMNAIFIYVVEGICTRLLGSINVGGMSAHEWLFQNLFVSWIHDPKLASLSCALAYMAIWWLVALVLAKLGWTIRV